MPAAKPETEVAISGGGPVALTLALLLARAGIRTTVFEKAPALSEDLRASTFHPPTLDMLGTLGLAEGMLADGIPCPHWQIRLHPSGERAVFDLSVLKGETAHPYRLQYEQWRLSALLLEALRAEPEAELRFGAEVTGLEQDEDGVTLTLGTGTGSEAGTETRAEAGTRTGAETEPGPATGAGSDTRTGAGSERHRARFVVGADGARSFVRRALDLDFAGETYPETTLLATTLFPFETHLEGLSNVSYCWKAGGNFALLRVPGRWRVSIYPREDLSLDEQLTPEAIEASLQEIVPSPEPFEVIERRPYRVHQRIVPSYYRGRVALAGDAAHVNAPTGGMGLNGGIHDAFELAEALTDRLRQGAGEDRFSLYERRRRPVAQEQILAQADANRRRMRERSPEKRREILEGLQAITRDPERLKAHLRKSSMLDGLRQAAKIT